MSARFIGMNPRWYSVGYRLPESHGPWELLSAEANREGQAAEMILQAMGWCGGWGTARECWEYPLAQGRPMELLPCFGFDLQKHLSGVSSADTQEVEILVDLVRQLSEIPFPRPVYFTPGDYGFGVRLVAEDNPAGSPCIDISGYSVQAQLPDSWSPWPGAKVEEKG